MEFVLNSQTFNLRKKQRILLEMGFDLNTVNKIILYELGFRSIEESVEVIFRKEIKSFHRYVKTNISEECLICHERIEPHKNRVDCVSNLNESYINEKEDNFEDP